MTVTTTGDVWILNLDMIESETGKIIEKVKVPVSEIGSSTGTFNETMVLYSKLRPYLNKVVLPDGPGYATNELVPMQPDETKLKREFLASLLRSDEFVTYAKHISGGTQMPRMPMNAIRKFECILPPIEMQNDFICLLRQSDKSKSYVTNYNVDKLMNNMLWHEFSARKE